LCRSRSAGWWARGSYRTPASTPTSFSARPHRHERRDHYHPFRGRGARTLDELIDPIASFLVPVFFVIMGVRTDLRAFGEAGVLSLAVTLSAAAILGKQLCALGRQEGVGRVYGVAPPRRNVT
jgi:hypothetical protein